MLQHNPLSSQTMKYKVSLRSKNGFYFIFLYGGWDSNPGPCIYYMHCPYQ